MDLDLFQVEARRTGGTGCPGRSGRPHGSRGTGHGFSRRSRWPDHCLACWTRRPNASGCAGRTRRSRRTNDREARLTSWAAWTNSAVITVNTIATVNTVTASSSVTAINTVAAGWSLD